MDKDKLLRVLNDFAVKNMGNRITEHLILGLKFVIINELFPEKPLETKPNG